MRLNVTSTSFLLVMTLQMPLAAQYPGRYPPGPGYPYPGGYPNESRIPVPGRSKNKKADEKAKQPQLQALTGVLQQIDAPQVLYDHPINMFVAGFIGSPSMNFVDAKLDGTADEMYVDAGSFRVPVPPEYAAKLTQVVGKECFFGIRPEDMYEPKYAPPEVVQNARVRARVDVTEPLGAEIYIYLLVGDHSLIARVDPRTRVDIGDEVELVLDMSKMHIFDRQTQEAYV